MLKRLFFTTLCLTLGLWPLDATMAQDGNKYRAEFIYETPAQDTAAPVDVTFTVLSTSYKTSGGLMWFTSEQFAGLHHAVRQDLQKVLAAKGFRVLGPYDDHDLIPYQDKKRIDLLLLTSIELFVSLKDRAEELENFWAWRSPTLQTGTAQVTGRMVIEARETASRELMWVKPINIIAFEFPYVVRIPWGTSHKRGALFSNDPLLNGMAKGLEEQYPTMMRTCHELLDPEEMSLIKKETQELKNKKGF